VDGRVAGTSRTRFQPGWPALLTLLALAALLLVLTMRAATPGPRDPLRLLATPDARTSVRLRGRLQADLRPGSEPCRGVLLLEGEHEGATALRFSTCPALQEGWHLEVSGLLRRPRLAPHPLLAGAAERLAQRGIHTELRVAQVRVLERPATPVADLRRRIADRFLTVAGPEVGGLLAALVLGSAVVPLPETLSADFRAAGLSHALAASGFHLTVLLGAVLALARPFGRSVRLPMAAGAIALFLLLAGPQASVVRAVVSGSLALLILESGRRGRPIGLLGLTVALMLLLQPLWWADLGFQLSVAATAGLLVSAAPLEGWLAGANPSRWRRILAAAVAVPLAASLWTLPLQLLHFGVVPLYAVPANLAVEPLLTPLTLGAMALALVALLMPALLAPLAWLLAWPSRLLLLLAHGFAALPMAQWQTGRPQPWLVLLFTVALLVLLVPPLARRWRWPALALLLLVGVLHTADLRADALLLVHQPGGDLLVARHEGRAALVASRADPFLCQQARRLAQGLGVGRYDWLLLLDPVAPAEPACWREQAGLSLLGGEATAPLAAGQRIASEGLEARALTMDSQALALVVGRQRWLLLPDRQALHSLERLTADGSARGLGPGSERRHQQPAPFRRSAGSEGIEAQGARVWLGFVPRPSERHRLPSDRIQTVWISGAPPAAAPALPGRWRGTGASGFLAQAGG
jgi:competence protein ComEC